MALHSVLMTAILAFSLASTEQCGSSIDLSLHSMKNASGHWIITVDTRRLTRKDDPRKFSVNVQHETRICERYEIEEHVLMAFVYPSLHDTSMPGAIEPSTTRPTTTSSAPPSTSTTTTATPSTSKITTATPSTSTSTTTTTTTTATPSTSTITTATPSTSTITTATPSTSTSTTTTATPSTSTITTATPSTSTITTATPSTSTITTATPSTSTSTTATPSTSITTATPSTTTSTITPKSCPHSGYQLYPGFNCYKAFPSGGEIRTWSEAREQCMRDGGDLMVLESERERKDVYLPLYNSTRFYYSPWVGVYIPPGENDWSSVKGEPVRSTWWASGQPVKNAAKCALVVSSGALWNWNCATTLTFICEISL